MIMGSVAKKPARAIRATEGGGDAGAEAKGQAAAEGSEARVFFASGGTDVLPAEVGITLGSCSLSKSAAEDDGVEVEQASGCTCKGSKEVALILVELKVLGVLGLLGGTDGVGFVGAPGVGVAGATNEAVGDRDVGDEGRSMAAKVEANVCTAVGVFTIVGRARKVVGRVSPADASGSGDLGPRLQWLSAFLDEKFIFTF